MHHRSLSTTAWLHRPRISSLAYLWRKKTTNKSNGPTKKTPRSARYFLRGNFAPKRVMQWHISNMEDFLGLNAFFPQEKALHWHMFYRPFFFNPWNHQNRKLTQFFPTNAMSVPKQHLKNTNQQRQRTGCLLKFWNAYLLRSSFPSFHHPPMIFWLKDGEIILWSHCWTKWLVSARMEALIWV